MLMDHVSIRKDSARKSISTLRSIVKPLPYSTDHFARILTKLTEDGDASRKHVCMGVLFGTRFLSAQETVKRRGRRCRGRGSGQARHRAERACH